MGRIRHNALLQNFPNPFNPETWIPYQLAKDANVSIAIYNNEGQGVRTLQLGHQPAGLYLTKSEAAHWDGRNNAGELVSSNIYFYHIRAGDFRPMAIVTEGCQHIRVQRTLLDLFKLP